MKTKVYIPLSITSKILGLPTTYIRELAERNKIPSLKIKGRLRFNPESVQKALDNIAFNGGGDNDD